MGEWTIEWNWMALRNLKTVVLPQSGFAHIPLMFWQIDSLKLWIDSSETHSDFS